MQTALSSDIDYQDAYIIENEYDPNNTLQLLMDSLKYKVCLNRWAESMDLCLKISKQFFDDEKFDRAIEFSLEALSIADDYYKTLQNNEDADNWNKLTGLAEVNAANVYARLLNFETAIVYFNKAIRRFGQSGDTVSLMPAINGLALAYNSISDHSKAISNFEKLIEIARNFNDSTMLAVAYNNTGLVEFNRGDYRESYNNYLEAGKIYHKIGDKKREAVTLYNIGVLQGNLGTYDSTMIYYHKALKIFIETTDFQGIAKVQLAMGQFFSINTRFNDAKQSFSDALKNAQRANAKHLIIEIYGNLAKLMEENSRFEKAYFYLKLYQEKYDSLFRGQQERIAELQKQYETEKRLREIDLLNNESRIKDLTIQKQRFRQKIIIMLGVIALLVMLFILRLYSSKISINKALSHQKQLLETANATKNKFFSIIAHDLKNLVSSTRYFAETLHDSANHLTELQKKRVIRGLYKSSRLTSDLTKDLMQWARTQSDNLEVYPEKCIIAEIADHEIAMSAIDAARRRIQIIKVYDESTFVFADKNMVALIIRNLLSNAIKFSFEGAQILIKAQDSDDLVEISIEDHGQGMHPKDVPMLFRTDINTSSIHSAGQKGTGLGLILCKEFVEKNQGTIKAVSTPGKGSIFIFTLPKWNKGENNPHHHS
jgi:signal transduction histidine kinase/tetratricopeptide (TPR) repeat protein